MIRSPTSRHVSNAQAEVILRPHVFVRDVLAAVGPELPKLAEAVYDLTEYCPDEPLEERLVRALIEPELTDGPLEEWIGPYKRYGLGVLHKLIGQLRVVNYREYCEVNELFGIERPFYEWTVNNEFRRVERPPSVHPRSGVYTLDLQLRVGSAAQVVTSQDTDAESPSVEGLASRLAGKLGAMVNGTELLAQVGDIGCLAALAATVWTVSQQRRAQTRHATRRFNSDVFDACLAELDLGPQVDVAHRILVRNHPRYLRIRTDGLPPGWTLPDWGGELGVFERDGDSLRRRNADGSEPRLGRRRPGARSNVGRVP